MSLIYHQIENIDFVVNQIYLPKKSFFTQKKKLMYGSEVYFEEKWKKEKWKKERKKIEERRKRKTY